jgi:hypothetical protein
MIESVLHTTLLSHPSASKEAAPHAPKIVMLSADGILKSEYIVVNEYFWILRNLDEK